MRKHLLLILTLVTSSLSGVTDAQSRYGAASYQASWETAGLELAWQATLSSSVAGGGNIQATSYVSPNQVRKIYEVVQDGQRTVFAPHHVGPRGRPLGDAGAQWQANLLQRTLVAQGITAAVEVREIPNISLLVQNNAGVVQNLDAETGAMRWTIAVGNVVYDGFSASANDDYVASVNGTTLYVISVETGKLIFERALLGWPATGPVVTTTHAFVPLTNGTVQTFALEEEDRRLPPKMMVSFGRITDRPVVSPSGIGWVTGRGSLYVADAERVRARFRIQSRAQFVGGPAYAKGDRWFVASNDGYLTCIDGNSERILWEFSTGETISSSPFVAADHVLIATLSNRLFAVEIKSGQEVWNAPGISRVIARMGDQLHCLDYAGKVRMLDSATGQQQGHFSLADGVRPLVNRTTDRIYLTTAGGTLKCLRRRAHPWPTIYAPMLPTESSGQAAPSTEPSTEPASDEVAASEEPAASDTDAMAAGDDDPFAGGDDDPFGAADDAGDDDPFGAADDAGDDDPFGAADDAGDMDAGDDDPFGGADTDSTDDDDPFG